ncbi:MAG: PAS domain-containing sensor histidine kinase [Acidobacteria bacterium]|nr:MAG: PAS domain-containing sensor histidine kinase [Acidobacteriota bacterium]
MRLLSLPPKLRLAPFWPALAAVATATVLLWSLLPSLLQRTAAVQLFDMLDLLAPIARDRLADPKTNLESWAEQLGADSGVRITLIRRDGVVLADSSVEPEHVRDMQNHRNRPEVRAAFASGRGTNVRKSATTGNTYVYVARTLSGPGGDVMILRLAEPLEQLDALKTRLAAAMGLAILAAGIAILFTSLWLDRRLFEPVSRLIGGAQDLARGRVSRVAVPDEEELAALALALNRLAATSEQQLDAISRERDNLQEILASMSEGVLVVDRDGRAQMINPAFYQLFDLVGDFTGRPALEIIRHPGFARLIEDTLRKRQTQSSQIVLPSPERRTLLLTSAVLSGGERGAVVAARDTTELTRVADMRRDFVANVSHELKTPLAAIRGYAETLRDGALDEPPTARRFTERILSQCRRLQELLDDLLILSRLEGMDAALDREPVDLDAVARRAVELLTPAAREKRVEIELQEEEVPAVQGDAGNLERLLLNLLDNAIKYNRPDGRITVRVGRDGGEALLEVSDTGIGIPAESIPRIFERFYRVDKGRAREEGGTGLGLAIVKHIAQAHGGQVDVESRMGRGATFRVRLPLAG